MQALAALGTPELTQPGRSQPERESASPPQARLMQPPPAKTAPAKERGQPAPERAEAVLPGARTRPSVTSRVAAGTGGGAPAVTSRVAAGTGGGAPAVTSRVAAGTGPGAPAPGVRPGRRASRARPGRKKRSLLSARTMAVAGTAVVVAGTAVVLLTRPSGSSETQAHALTTPGKLGCFVKDPQLAVQMQARTLQQEIVRRSSGTAKNVIYAVYEDSTCPDAATTPQVVLFIGGKLSGTSPSSFMSGFTSSLRGAVPTTPGSLGGDAACAPSLNGHPAECAWADNDTFGAVISANLNAAGLAKQMRQMRPLIELPVGPADKPTPAAGPPSSSASKPASPASPAPAKPSSSAG